MPIYDYSCRNCQHTFESLVDDGETPVCPKCHSQSLERLLSLPARPAQAAGKIACTSDPSTPPCGPLCGRWTG